MRTLPDVRIDVTCQCGATVRVPEGHRRKCRSCGAWWSWDGRRLRMWGGHIDPDAGPLPFHVSVVRDGPASTVDAIRRP